MMTATTSAASTHMRGLRTIVFMPPRLPPRSRTNLGPGRVGAVASITPPATFNLYRIGDSHEALIRAA
jgi:hypothetical protein